MRKIAAFLFIPISAWKALLAWHFFFLTVQTVQSQIFYIVKIEIMSYKINPSLFSCCACSAPEVVR